MHEGLHQILHHGEGLQEVHTPWFIFPLVVVEAVMCLDTQGTNNECKAKSPFFWHSNHYSIHPTITSQVIL